MNTSNTSKDQTSATPQRNTKENISFDPFILDLCFPTPSTIFSVITPSILNLHADCVFALDANVLLSSYKFESGQFKDIEQIYQGLARTNRLFVPSRAAQEFAKNRSTVLKDLYDKLNGWKSTLEKMPSHSKVQCPMLEENPAYNSLVESAAALHEMRAKYKDALTALMNDLQDWSWDDPVSLLYKELFIPNRIISHSGTHEECLKDLRHRIQHKLPPGYKDGSKDDEGIGDLLIWKSLLNLAKTQKVHVIFVCNEEKSDWVVRTQSTVLAVRPELTSEFYRETNHHFGLVSYSGFLKLMNAKPETIDQARSLESENNYRFLRIQQRVSAILEELADVIREYVFSEPEDEVDNIGSGVDRLIRDFLIAKEHYTEVIHSPSGELHLIHLAQDAGEIQSLNRQLQYIAARMKHSGEEQSANLRKVCQDFLEHYEAWGQWYLAGSPCQFRTFFAH
ncbi:PIN domain-containing protein [Planctomicrobium sp. SH527]|uniref:PIN domain-containing protein n=1 Tax=Planctomicrobium sp. SH527 TaxID=3448123 RepID=UPI003F5BE589